MNYQAVIIEDEPIAQDIIKEYLNSIPSVELAGVCKDAFEAGETLKKKQIDLLFLDIHLPRLSGLNFLKTLPHPPKIIVTTAYQEYALEGYELAVCDYLLKPISLERFMKAVNKALYELDLENQNKPPPGYTDPQETEKVEAIFVKSEEKITKIPVANIWYLEAYGNYVKIYTPNGIHLSNRNLSHYEEKLKGRHFIRIHRSYVVPFSRIEALEGNQVIVAGTKLPVSQAYKPALLEMMKE